MNEWITENFTQIQGYIIAALGVSVAFLSIVAFRAQKMASAAHRSLTILRQDIMDEVYENRHQMRSVNSSLRGVRDEISELRIEEVRKRLEN